MKTEIMNKTDKPLSPELLRKMDAYWRAANYLSVGQIYLLDNPLLRRPLQPADIKPRLLGHWGTTPGLNFIWTHADRVIKARDLDAIMIVGPGHGGPAAVANAYLEGTWSERYSAVGLGEKGIAVILVMLQNTLRCFKAGFRSSACNASSSA